jgi:hypothetical protein
MPLPLYPREWAPGTHFIGSWVDPRAGLDDMEKWKFFTISGLELPLPLVVQPVASRYTDWAIPAPGLEVNKEKTKYTLMSRYQNIGKNYNIKMANRHFENAEKVKYLGATATSQSLIPEEIKIKFR